jgi:hypothetical protein
MADVWDEQLWQDFLAARDRATSSLTVTDGLACRRAWMAFLEKTGPGPKAKPTPPGASQLRVTISPPAPDMPLRDIVAGYKAADAIYSLASYDAAREDEVAELTYGPWYRLLQNTPDARDINEALMAAELAVELCDVGDHPTASSLIEAILPFLGAVRDASDLAEAARKASALDAPAAWRSFWTNGMQTLATNVTPSAR